MSEEPPINFLLVDDVPQNLEALEALLAADGLRLFKAQSGAQALELMLEHEFALALLDVQMPEMDGFELAEIMRSTERTRAIPIIFLTAVATDEQRRFRGYEAGAVDYLLKPIDTRMLRSKTDVFFELSRQRQTLARQRDALRDTAEQLATTLNRLNAHRDNSPLAIVEFEPDLRLISWTRGAERLFGWSAEAVLGRHAGTIGWMDAETAGAVTRHVAALTLGGEQRDMQVHTVKRIDGAALECEFYYSLLLDHQGRPASVSVQILDITERRRAEETQHLLIGELNHRVKNTLASVQAIAFQTLKGAPSPAEFADKFTGRLQALAQAHSLLSRQTWQSASLSQLVQDQLDLGTIDEGRCSVSGPQVELPPNLALHLALVLHELGTNAAKYGALSNREGHVFIDWRITDDRLLLSWRESGGPAVTPPTRKGFGTVLVERSLLGEGGVVSADYPVEGVHWQFDLPWSPVVVADMGPARLSTGGAAPEPVIYGERLNSHTILEGLDFLVVEDEPLIAFELADVLTDAGARVVGTPSTLDEAVDAVETLAFDAAILDGNLQGAAVDQIAEALDRRGIPFLFLSGYGPEHLPVAFNGRPLLNKPFDRGNLLTLLRHIVEADAPEPLPGRRVAG